MPSSRPLAVSVALLLPFAACRSGNPSTVAAPLVDLSGDWTFTSEVTFVTLVPGVPCNRVVGEKSIGSVTLTQSGNSVRTSELPDLGTQRWTLTGDTLTGTQTITDVDGTTTISTNAAVTKTSILGTRVTTRRVAGSDDHCQVIEKITATRKAAARIDQGVGGPDVIVVFDDNSVELGWTVNATPR